VTEIRFYDYDLPGFTYKKKRLPGKLIVLEGTDGVGRSTQIALLQEWLESEGYAVAATGLKRGMLAGKGIKSAMQGHTLGDTTINLLYATDFADRLEQDIIPALRAGFVVLTDRYVYSVIARAQARGVDPAWLRNVFGFALVPDAVFYLQADLVHLIPRVLNVRGFDYWESGVDFLSGRDYYDSFTQYQSLLLAQFDAIADEFNFVRVDANGSILDVFRVLRDEIRELIKGMKPPKMLMKELEERQSESKAREKEKLAEEAAPATSKDIDADKHTDEPEKAGEVTKAGQPAQDESPGDGAEDTTAAEEISENGPRWKEWLERLRPSH
jgi:dTMP kinase